MENISLKYYGLKLMDKLMDKYGFEGVMQRSCPFYSVLDGAKNSIRIVKDVLWKCILFAEKGGHKLVMPCGRDDIYYRPFWPKVRVYRFRKQGDHLWTLGKLK